MRRLFFGVLAVVTAIGCGSQPAATPPAAAPVDPAVAEQPAQSFKADMSATGLGNTPVSDADLAKYKKNYDAAKAASLATPSSTDLKDSYLIATVWYGSGTMYAASLDAKPKYRGALALYREAITIEPKSDKAKQFAAEAIDNKRLIESIYESMGKSVPQ